MTTLWYDLDEIDDEDKDLYGEELEEENLDLDDEVDADEDDIYCRECGELVEDGVQCPVCGLTIDEYDTRVPKGKGRRK